MMPEEIAALVEENAALRAEVATLRRQNGELQEQLEEALRQLAELAQRQSSRSVSIKPNRPRKKRAPEHNRSRKREEPTRVERHALEQCPECDYRLRGRASTTRGRSWSCHPRSGWRGSNTR